MARERYQTPLLCPSCGRTGVAEMSDKKSYMLESDYDTRADEVPEGFVIVGKAGVNCQTCGVSAKE